MKRVLLIAGGTLGGLGAVLAITPPQINSTSSVGTLPSANPAAPTSATKSAAPAPSAVATKKSTPTAKAKAKAKATAKATAQATQNATPSQSQSSTSSNVSGTYTGNAVDVGYGIVQVKITVANGKITDAQAVQAPSGRNDRYTNMSVPVLRQRTLAAQSANINGVSGASYTSYGWYTSLTSALKQAGL